MQQASCSGLRAVHSVTRLSTRLVGSANWGPNAQMRQGYYFVGTRPHPMKYYAVLQKKGNQKHGLQGANHLIPEKGSIYAKKPAKMLLEKDKVYTWCSCGYSNRQPLCDGTHGRKGVSTRMKPVRYIPERDMEVWLCQCKQSNNRPFCDGAHTRIKDAEDYTMEDIRGLRDIS